MVNMIPHFRELGINALYLGPLFESSAHGYDTLDYYFVDRRLGTNDDLIHLISELHNNGIRVIIDAVFNHTGRFFFAFKDLQANGENSVYRDWYAGINFASKNQLGDNFTYEGWSGNFDLVKLNLKNHETRNYLLETAEYWIKKFDIDGLRLDAADVLLPGFREDLAKKCKSLKQNFWLMGEVVHGDYAKWACDGGLDSVTNYVLYKGLWSSFNDRNFYEIVWTLNQQYGTVGKYRHLYLYNFTDNHDVDRVASLLKDKGHLFPLYGLFFTLPGIPSIYYGSEYAVSGKRSRTSDYALRPSWKELEAARQLPQANSPYKPPVNSGELYAKIRIFINLRKEKIVLQKGSYRQIFTAREQFVFLREHAGEKTILVAVNIEKREKNLEIKDLGITGSDGDCWLDLLENEKIYVEKGKLRVRIHSNWIKILERCS